MTIEPASRSAIFTLRQWAVCSILYGALTMIGGPARWGGEAFRILNFVPGGCYTVGGLFATVGVGVLIGSARGVYRLRDGFMRAAFWLFVALAGAFLVAGIIDRNAPIGGWVFLAGVALQWRVLRRLRSRMPADDASSG